MKCARFLTGVVLIAVIIAVDAVHAVAHAAAAEPSFEIYGFAQADFIFATAKADPDRKDGFRPSKISTDPNLFGSGTQTSISVKQSRFGVQGGRRDSEDFGGINFKFEFDMFGVGADAGTPTANGGPCSPVRRIPCSWSMSSRPSSNIGGPPVWFFFEILSYAGLPTGANTTR